MLLNRGMSRVCKSLFPAPLSQLRERRRMFQKRLAAVLVYGLLQVLHLVTRWLDILLYGISARTTTFLVRQGVWRERSPLREPERDNR